ncbi:MAG TPA: hypothetical protein VFN56_04110 [Candidatus Saccharimonadales bacterium]|nr:hypothetical protein [Candidatus Saccharimonadales bacterium]
MSEFLDTYTSEQPPFIRAVACANEVDQLARRFTHLRDPQGFVSFMVCDAQSSVLSYRWNAQLNAQNGLRTCTLELESLPVHGAVTSEIMTISGVGPNADGDIYAVSTHSRVAPSESSSLILQQAFAREAEIMLQSLRLAIRCRNAE